MLAVQFAVNLREIAVNPQFGFVAGARYNRLQDVGCQVLPLAHIDNRVVKGAAADLHQRDELEDLSFNKCLDSLLATVFIDERSERPRELLKGITLPVPDIGDTLNCHIGANIYDFLEFSAFDEGHRSGRHEIIFQYYPRLPDI